MTSVCGVTLSEPMRSSTAVGGADPAHRWVHPAREMDSGNHPCHRQLECDPQQDAMSSALHNVSGAIHVAVERPYLHRIVFGIN